ncbi:MAG: EAL domain-containing protein [Dokdonella sp.]
MGRFAGVVGLVVAILLAIALPIGASLYLASQQGMQAEVEQVELLSRSILRRTEEVGRQGFAAFDAMDAQQQGDACSAANVALMEQLQMRFSYIKAVGHVENGRLMCSSWGRYKDGLPLGPVSYVSARGVAIRPAVVLSTVPDKAIFIAQRGGTAIMTDQALATDLLSGIPDLSVGVFAQHSRTLMAATGAFEPDWAVRSSKSGSTHFFDGAYVVAIQRSQNFDYAAFAAVPAAHLRQREHALAIVLVPMGLVLAALLVALVLRQARLSASLPVTIRAALARKEFHLLYQPIVDLRTGAWVGAEALIRWRRADGMLTMPDAFIPVAEEHGLICRITEQVVAIVAREAGMVLAQRPHFHFGINVSSADLSLPQTVELLRGLIETPGFSPANIVIEATERGLLETGVARKIVQDIRALGIRAAIDDFGTGYSGLSYLGTFEVDYLKIDKSFVDTVGTDAVTSEVAVHIIEMARTLRLEMVAEGVENSSQAQFLKERGVQYAQGWWFAKPMSLDDLLAALKAQASPDGERVPA